MPLTDVTKAKHHFFLDVSMSEVLTGVDEEKLHPGAGSKLLITLGPSCQDVDTLVRMLEAGVTCARIDLTWGTLEFHRRSLHNLSTAMRQTRKLCSVWLNTAGREMVVRRKVEYDERGWPLHGESVRAEKGQIITITTNPAAEPSSSLFPINYPSFSTLVQPGQMLQVGRYLSTGADGGSLFLKVLEVTEADVICEATTDATLEGLLTIMICHTCESVDSVADLDLPLLTQHDVECIKTFSKEFEIDYISLSYCNSAQDVYECRALLDSIHMLQTKIVAKVERKAAIINFVAIAEAADGVILSRGNLGLDFDPEVMAILQKRGITRCNRLGKPIILTRIVDTMVNAPRPTRAEATDVANAVLDGADGVMLGAETLQGLYPVETVEMVMKLAHVAEEKFDFATHHEMLVNEQFDAKMPMLVRGGSSGYLDSPDAHYGLSPTTRLVPPHYFTPTADGNNNHSSPADGMQHASYTTAGTLHPPAFGSVVLPAGAGGAGEVSTVYEGPNCSIYASPHTAAARYTSSFGNLPHLLGMKRSESAEALRRAQISQQQVLRLESIASSAVRCAEKINAGLIMVMTQSGRTASLVAKYRPPMPILAVVVPTLRSDGLGWRLEGKYLARQCLIIRGVVPMLAAPMSEGSEDLMSEAIYLATSQNLAKPNDYVVVVCNQKGALVFKVVQVNEAGTGMKLMSCGNSLIANEDPDIISSNNPFTAFSAGRRSSRGLSFKGAGAFGGSTAAGSPMFLAPADAQAVAIEGSIHGGVLGGVCSMECDADIAAAAAAQDPSASMRQPVSPQGRQQQRQSSLLRNSLPGALSP